MAQKYPVLCQLIAGAGAALSPSDCKRVKLAKYYLVFVGFCTYGKLCRIKSKSFFVLYASNTAHHLFDGCS